MTALELNRLLTQAMQAGAEEMAKAAGVPAAKYQSIALGVKWQQRIKERRATIAKQAKSKLEEE
jgi:hypothetical protein